MDRASASTASPARSSASARRTTSWQRWAQTPLNERQIELIDRLLDGFDGKQTSSKWAAKARCSPDTALPDISALMALGVLKKSESGGRSTSYELSESS